MRRRKNRAVHPMVMDRLSRLPRKLMPRMFRGFTAKQTTRTVSGTWKLRGIYQHWIPPCHFRKKQLHPNLADLPAETPATWSSTAGPPGHTLPTRPRTTSTGVCEGHSMPSMLVTNTAYSLDLRFKCFILFSTQFKVPLNFTYHYLCLLKQKQYCRLKPNTPL